MDILQRHRKQAAIRFEDLTLGYSKSDIISDLSAEIPKSRVTALLGQNGSGKTTILRALIKCLNPKSGRIYLSGKDLAGIGVEELPGLLSYAPAELDDNIGLSVLNAVSNAKRGKRWVEKDQAMAALEYLGIGALAPRPFNELSTGQKRLVLIARAMAVNAPIVLLDEPTSGLDPSNRQRILKAIKGLSRMGFTVVVATQDLDMALESDWVIAVKHGKAVATGRSGSILTGAMLSRLYDSRIRVEVFRKRKVAFLEKIGEQK